MSVPKLPSGSSCMENGLEGASVTLGNRDPVVVTRCPEWRHREGEAGLAAPHTRPLGAHDSPSDVISSSRKSPKGHSTARPLWAQVRPTPLVSPWKVKPAMSSGPVHGALWYVMYSHTEQTT